MRPMPSLALVVASLLVAGTAAAQPAPRAPRTIKPLTPAATAGRTSPSPAIIVQGGISPNAPCNARGTGTYSDGSSAPDLGARADAGVTIGPKQDDPVGPRPTPALSAASPTASGRAQLAIGPKQDDPVGPKPAARDSASGMATGSAAVAIGPKQDDPAPPPPADLSRCMRASH